MNSGERQNPFGILRGCGGYRRPYFHGDPVYRNEHNLRQLLSEVKVMYTRGEIATDLYVTIKSEIAAGEFTWEELRCLKQEKAVQGTESSEQESKIFSA